MTQRIEMTQAQHRRLDTILRRLEALQLELPADSRPSELMMEAKSRLLKIGDGGFE